MKALPLASAAALFVLAANSASAAGYALQCGKTFDSAAARMLGAKTVVVEGNRIKAVLDGKADVEGAQAVDLSGHTKGGKGSEGEFCRTFHSVSPGSDCDGSNLGARCPTGLSGRRLFCIKLSQAEVLREVCDNLLSSAPPRSARVDIRRQDDDPAAAYSDRR